MGFILLSESALKISSRSDELLGSYTRKLARVCTSTGSLTVEFSPSLLLFPASVVDAVDPREQLMTRCANHSNVTINSAHAHTLVCLFLGSTHTHTHTYMRSVHTHSAHFALVTKLKLLSVSWRALLLPFFHLGHKPRTRWQSWPWL